MGYQPSFGTPSKNDATLLTLQKAEIPANYLKHNYLHAKAIVADDLAYVGSQNFTGGGLINNREVGAMLTDPAVVETLVQTFLADQASPD